MRIDVSPGELFDRLTILEIKLGKIVEPARRAGLERSHAELVGAAAGLRDVEIDRLVAELKRINAALWDIEDNIRAHERRQDFGTAFVELARAVYMNNDRRSALKRQIDDHLGSDSTEEKSYTPYQPPSGQ